MGGFLLYRERLFLKTQGSLPLISLSFFLLLIVLYHWMEPDGLKPGGIVSMVSLFSLISLFLTADQVFKTDFERGGIDVLYHQRVPFIPLILMRFLSYFFLVVLPLTGMLGAALAMLGLQGLVFIYLPYFLLFQLIYVLLILVAVVYTQGAENQKGLMFLICLPLFVPLFLTQLHLIEELVQGGQTITGLKLALGLLCVLGPMSLMAIRYGLQLNIQD